MANISISLDDIVDKAIAGAPHFKTAELKALTPVRSSVLDIADKLDKLASQIESEKAVSLTEFKVSQAEKKAALTQIVKTYLELESQS